MITENTLRVLNDIGFGANIDKLEAYILDYKCAENVSDLSRYKHNFKILESILKETKPSSRAFEFESKQLPLNDYDIIFKEKQNIRCDILYGISDDSKIKDKCNLVFSDTSLMDTVAINNVEGIDVICVYEYGELKSVSAVSESTKQFDFTDELYEAVYGFIEDFSSYSLVELRAKATVLKTDIGYKNAICDAMHRLRTGVKTDKVRLIYNDIFILEDEREFNTYWDKLQYLRQVGLSVPHHCMLRNIDSDAFKSALNEFDEFFLDIEKDEGYTYNYNGFLVRNNKEVQEYKFLTCYDTLNTDSKQLFESTVKGIVMQDGELYISILETDCNKRVRISKIYLEDIFDLEKSNITVGSRVKFKVIEGKAIVAS